MQYTVFAYRILDANSALHIQTRERASVRPTSCAVSRKGACVRVKRRTADEGVGGARSNGRKMTKAMGTTETAISSSLFIDIRVLFANTNNRLFSHSIRHMYGVVAAMYSLYAIYIPVI